MKSQIKYKTISGEMIPVDEMSDQHINNALAMILRVASDEDKKRLLKVISYHMFPENRPEQSRKTTFKTLMAFLIEADEEVYDYLDRAEEELRGKPFNRQR